MWPASHSRALAHVEDLQRRVAVAALVQLVDVDALDALDGALLLAPARHAAGEVAADARACRRRRELGRARARRRRRGRRTRPRWSRSASQASLVPKPARSVGMQTAPGMCASSNCRSVRTSTTQRAVARAAARPGAASSGSTSTPSVSSGPRLSVDDRAGSSAAAGRARRARARRTRPRRRSRSSGVVRALEADRRGDLHVHPGPAAQRAAEVAGPDLDVVGQRRAACSCSERKMPRAPSAFSTARSGRAMSPTNSVSPVSTAHGSSPRARVDQRERGVLGPVAGRVQRARRAASPSSSSQPSSNGSCVVVGRGVAVDVDRRAGRGREPAVAGDVVGVVVGLEHVLDAHAHVAREREVLVDLEARVDDRGDARVLVADQVGGAAEVVVGDLAEDHREARRDYPARPLAWRPSPPASPSCARSRPRRSTSCARSPPSSSGPVLLFSGGKDSIVLLRARREGVPARRRSRSRSCTSTPGHNFPEVLEFRDRRVARARRAADRRLGAGLDRRRARVEEDRPGRLAQPAADRRRCSTRSREHGFDAAFGGARRDEERARAKERVLLVPRRARPVGAARPAPRAVEPLQRRASRRGEHVRVFPLSQLDRARRLALHRAPRSSSCRRSTSPTSARCSSATGCCSPTPSA